MHDCRRLEYILEIDEQAPVLALVRGSAPLAIWRTGLVECDLGPQSLGELGLPSGGGQTQRSLGRRNGLGEPADLRIGGPQGGREHRISAASDLFRPSG